jgi:peptide/nickel transport system substrate-binding protein
VATAPADIDGELQRMVDVNRDDQAQRQAADDLTRRSFLTKGAALAGAGAVLPGVLAACGGVSSTHSSTTQRPSSQFAGTPSKGGTLRIAMQGNGASETFNPSTMSTPIDFLHGYSAFDPMVRVAPNYQTEPGLIVGWTPNRTNDVYELKLRKGVTWHDGKPFTADDLIYTLHFLGNPANLGYSAVANVRLNDVKKLSDHLVRVPLKAPNSRLSDLFVYANMSLVIQQGTKDFSKPIGTGPFKLDSFVPGKQASLSANREYWDQPGPYPDRLEILSIDDDTARVGALQSGNADVVWPFPAVQAKSVLSGSGNSNYGVFVDLPGRPMSFYMRCDQAPFNDNRVRTAIKLSIDRPALIDAAFNGFATPANDIPGQGLPLYDTSLPQRKQDVEKAKSLLKSAGRSDLRIQLYTCQAFAGQQEAATAYAQQAKQSGITVNLKVVPPSIYFNPSQLYLKMGFAQSVWPVAALQFFYSSACLSDGSLNESHYKSASFDQLYAKTIAETGSNVQSLWNQVQSIQYNQGGNIFWANQQGLLGVSNKVRGFNPKSGWMYEVADFNTWKWGLSS